MRVLTTLRCVDFGSRRTRELSSNFCEVEPSGFLLSLSLCDCQTQSACRYLTVEHFECCLICLCRAQLCCCQSKREMALCLWTDTSFEEFSAFAHARLACGEYSLAYFLARDSFQGRMRMISPRWQKFHSSISIKSTLLHDNTSCSNLSISSYLLGGLFGPPVRRR